MNFERGLLLIWCQQIDQTIHIRGKTPGKNRLKVGIGPTYGEGVGGQARLCMLDGTDISSALPFNLKFKRLLDV